MENEEQGTKEWEGSEAIFHSCFGKKCHSIYHANIQACIRDE